MSRHRRPSNSTRPQPPCLPHLLFSSVINFVPSSGPQESPPVPPVLNAHSGDLPDRHPQHRRRGRHHSGGQGGIADHGGGRRGHGLRHGQGGERDPRGLCGGAAGYRGWPWCGWGGRWGAGWRRGGRCDRWGCHWVGARVRARPGRAGPVSGEEGVESRAWLSEKNAMWVCTGRHNGNHLCRMKGCIKRKAWLLAKHTSKYFEVL